MVEQVRSAGAAVSASALLVVAPFLSPQSRNRLADAGVGWFDATGNMKITLDRPSVLIERTGAMRNPFRDPSDRRLKSLRGCGAARIVRSLLETEPPVGVRDLAQDAGVGAATSARTLDLLARDSLIERGSGNEIIDVRKSSLVHRWINDYGLLSSNDVESTMDPRGLEHTLAGLRASGDQYVVTGSAAARALLPADILPVTPLTTIVIYADSPTLLSRRIGLRATTRAANVLLVKPFDDVLTRGAFVREGVRYAAAAQVTADLLTGPGRAAEEADQLIAVLAEEDARWAA